MSKSIFLFLCKGLEFILYVLRFSERVLRGFCNTAIACAHKSNTTIPLWGWWGSSNLNKHSSVKVSKPKKTNHNSSKKKKLLWSWRAFINVEEHNLHKINLKWHTAFYYISLFVICRWWKARRTMRLPLAMNFVNDYCYSCYLNVHLCNLGKGHIKGKNNTIWIIEQELLLYTIKH